MTPRLLRHASRLTSLAFLLTAAPASPASQSCQPTWIPTFTPKNVLDNVVTELVIFDDGNGPDLYLGGSFLRGGTTVLNRVGRWTGTGSGFAPLGGGLPSGDVTDLDVYDAGGGDELYASGRFSNGGGIARWDGSAWVAVGGGVAIPVPAYPGEYPWVTTSEVFDAGSGPELYVSGYFHQAGNVPASGFAKWNGTTWTAVPPPSNGGSDLMVFDDGSGPALYASGFGVSRMGPSGTWTNMTANSIAIARLVGHDFGAGPTLFAIGTFQPFGFHDLAFWNGSSWTQLGGGFQVATGLCVFDDGTGAKLYVQGSAGGTGVLRSWDGVAWQTQPGSLGKVDGTPGLAVALQPFDDGTGSRLFVGGSFASAGGSSAGNFARFDGATWEGGQPGIDANVLALAVHDDGSGDALFAGGQFTTIGKGVAKWDGAGWSSLGAGISTGAVQALASYEDGAGRDLYVGGRFHAGGDPGNAIARWDGQAWSALGSGLTGGSSPQVAALIEFDDGSGKALFAGGQFTTAGGIPASNVAKWNGSAWSALGSGVNGRVNALEVFDDGSGPKLYLAGEFHLAGGTNFERIARWDGTNLTALNAGQTHGGIYDLQVFDEGGGPQLYAGGWFTQVGGVAANGVARWDGSAWSTLGTGMNAYQVRALHVFDDGSGDALFVAGNHIQGQSMLAKWNGTWTHLAPGTQVSGHVGMALAAFDDGAHDAIYVGGAFPDSPPGDPNLARYGCPSVPPISVACPGDGSGTACPCGNHGAAGHGCANSANAAGAVLGYAGSASVLGEDLVLHGSGMPSQSICLYFQGTDLHAGGAGLVFGDGLLCVKGSVIRLAVKSNSAGASSYPGPGDPSIVVRGAIPAGGGVRRTYQVWYRNPASFCTPHAFNLTNALVVDWQP